MERQPAILAGQSRSVLFSTINRASVNPGHSEGLELDERILYGWPPRHAISHRFPLDGSCRLG